MSIHRIDLSHVQDVPLEQDELTAIVTSWNVALPNDLSADDITSIWERVQQQRKENGLLENRDFPRYFLVGVEGNQLLLALNKYSLFLATNDRLLLHRRNNSLTEELLENYLRTGYSIMGLSAAIMSAEGAILIQRRSGAVTQGAGTYMTPAGGFMPNHYSDVALMTPDPFISAQKQILFEQGITPDEVTLKYVGLSSDTLVSPNPGLTFYGHTRLTMEELETRWRKAKDNYESDFIRFISGNPEELLHTIRGELKDVSGIPLTQSIFLGVGLGVLMLYGKAQFGNDWFAQACKEAVKNTATGIEEARIS